MFSIFEVVSGYMRTIVLPDNMFIFQEGRIRKPGKLKGKKVPLLKNFLIAYLMTPTYTSLDANKTVKYNCL